MLWFHHIATCPARQTVNYCYPKTKGNERTEMSLQFLYTFCKTFVFQKLLAATNMVISLTIRNAIVQMHMKLSNYFTSIWYASTLFFLRNNLNISYTGILLDLDEKYSDYKPKTICWWFWHANECYYLCISHTSSTPGHYYLQTQSRRTETWRSLEEL